MSEIHSSDCVDCGLPCLGKSCPHWERVDYYCDSCNDYAEYEIDGEHYCESCAKDVLQEAFDDLMLSEKAEMLDIDLREIWS